MSEHKKSRPRLTHLERHAICVVLAEFLSRHDVRTTRDTLDLGSDGEAAMILESLTRAKAKLFHYRAALAATPEGK